METNYFLALSKVECEVEKKNWLNYISWSDAWTAVKKLHPDATYRKVMNELDNTFLFHSGTGGMVMCEVTINGISHTADLAITDFKNQAIKFEDIKSTDIMNTTQRAFAKAIAMHWIWLYVYRWEDLPEEDHDKWPTTSVTPPKGFITSLNIKNVIKSIKNGEYIVSSKEEALKLAETYFIIGEDKKKELFDLYSKEIL